MYRKDNQLRKVLTKSRMDTNGYVIRLYTNIPCTGASMKGILPYLDHNYSIDGQGHVCTVDFKTPDHYEAFMRSIEKPYSTSYYETKYQWQR